MLVSIQRDQFPDRTDLVLRDLRVLAAHASGIQRDRLLLHMDDDVTDDVVARFKACVVAYRNEKPLARIVGHREFWGRRFHITDDVLDPRADTETLIGCALDLSGGGRVLDLGTGSGAIGVTLAAEWPESHVTCVDISDAALQVAEDNAARLGVSDRMAFLTSSWFTAVSNRFDLIVSNPPYVTTDEWQNLSKSVQKFDPKQALEAGSDGLDDYRKIVAGAGQHLIAKGVLILEIGWQQARSVGALLEDAGFSDVSVFQDMEGRDRVMSAKWRNDLV